MSEHLDGNELPTMSGPGGGSDQGRPGAEGAGDEGAYPGFEVKGEMGRGGFGVVRLARESALKRDVALKTATGPKGADPMLLDRFLEEACITAQLQHPGIVPVYRLDTDAHGRQYYTMRPIEGRSLRDIIAKLKEDDADTSQQFPLWRLVRVLHSVCQTVHFAHDRGVVHRDLTPANIVVGDYGEVIVIDWGLAKVMPAPSRGDTPEGGEDESKETWRRLYERQVEGLRTDRDTSFKVTRNGTVMGTPSYMSPEQILGETDKVDGQSDVWSLGAILYEVCTLKRPFEAKRFRDLSRLVAMADPPDPVRVSPRRQVPPELAEIALRCLKRDKAERHASVGHLAQELENWLEGIAPWRVVADVDFGTLPDGPAEGWTALAAVWAVQDGLLTSPDTEGVLLLNVPVVGNVRVEVEAMLLAGPQGEISVMIDAPVPGMGDAALRSVDAGYCLQWGADYDTCTKLAKNGSDVARVETPCEPGKWHNVVAERVGNLLRITADGEELLHWRDYVPLRGERVGLYCGSDLLRVRRFRILSHGVPVTVSCLAVPDAFYNEGMIREARQQYLRVAECHPARQEGQEALFLAGKCAVELAGKGETGDDHRERLLAEARDSFDRLEAGPLAPLGCLGKSLIHQLGREPKKEAAELVRAFEDHPGCDTLCVIGERLWQRARGPVPGPAVELFALPAARLYPQGLLNKAALTTVAHVWDLQAARSLLSGFIRCFPHRRVLCVEAQFRLADCLTREHRFDEAVEAYAEAARQYSVRRTTCACALLSAATARRHQNRLEDTIALCRQVLAEYRDCPGHCSQAMIVMGGAMAYSGRYEEAMAQFTRALREYPDQRSSCTSALGMAAVALDMQGRYGEAEAYRARILEDYPGESDACKEALRERCLSLLLQGRYDEALAQWPRTELNDWDVAFLHALRGEREQVLAVLRRRSQENHDWFCIAVLDPENVQKAADARRRAVGDRKLAYDLAQALAAYARGQDSTAIALLRRIVADEIYWNPREISGRFLAKLVADQGSAEGGS